MSRQGPAAIKSIMPGYTFIEVRQLLAESPLGSLVKGKERWSRLCWIQGRICSKGSMECSKDGMQNISSMDLIAAA